MELEEAEEEGRPEDEGRPQAAVCITPEAVDGSEGVDMSSPRFTRPVPKPASRAGEVPGLGPTSAVPERRADPMTSPSLPMHPTHRENETGRVSRGEVREGREGRGGGSVQGGEVISG